MCDYTFLNELRYRLCDNSNIDVQFQINEIDIVLVYRLTQVIWLI